MRRFYGWMVIGSVCVSLLGGCGSAGEGRDGESALELRLQQFNGDNITQADIVGANNAQIDVFQSLCVTQAMGGMGGPMITLEPFTETLINAVFRNDQK